jgi:hypothetical protein
MRRLMSRLSADKAEALASYAKQAGGPRVWIPLLVLVSGELNAGSRNYVHSRYSPRGLAGDMMTTHV